MAAGEFGWRPPLWFADVRRLAMPVLATPQRASAAFRAAGWPGDADSVDVQVPGLTPEQMVDWRLGMVHLAPFVVTLARDRLEALRRRAVELLGPEPEPLVRRTIELRAVG
jgi:hypothetical protein